jgi:hypothetical protein
MKVQLPQNYRRVADAFDGLPEADKARVISHLESQPGPTELNKTVDQIIHNGGPEAELVGRIFQRNVNPAEKQGQAPGGIRTVDNKKLEPIQRKDAGTGAAGAGELQTEEPHTSTANPPAHGHEGRTVAQPGDQRTTEASINENAEVSPKGATPKGEITQADRAPQRAAPTSTRPASSRSDE